MVNDRDDEAELEMPYHVRDIYSDGIATVHLLGNENFRAVHFAWERDILTSLYVRVVVARIVQPRSSLLPGDPIAKQLAKMRHIRPPGRNHRELDGH